MRCTFAVLTSGSLLIAILVFCVGCETSQPIADRSAPLDTLAEQQQATNTTRELTPIELLKEKAEAGDAQAQYELGEMYDTGKGVKKDPSEAFKWWMQAANQGLAIAQHNVGVAYVAGIGVSRDKEEAVKWFRRAASQGDTEADGYAVRLSLGLTASQMVYGAGPPHRTVVQSEGTTDDGEIVNARPIIGAGPVGRNDAPRFRESIGQPVETVSILRVMDLDSKAIIERANGERYLVEYGIGALSLWRYEGKTALITSPGLFLGVGSKILLPDVEQEARIWSATQIAR